MRGEYPILPAYFFYLEHSGNKNILNSYEFRDLFMSGLESYIHPISLRVKEAEMDIEAIHRILDNYYNIQYLHDKTGELIKIV